MKNMDDAEPGVPPFQESFILYHQQKIEKTWNSHKSVLLVGSYFFYLVWGLPYTVSYTHKWLFEWDELINYQMWVSYIKKKKQSYEKNQKMGDLRV